MLSQQLCRVTQSFKRNLVGILESSWSTHRDVCAIEIRNTVTSLIRTPKGQYRMCALQRCLCYSDRKYSLLFCTDSKTTVSSVHIAKISMLQRQEIRLALQYGLQKDGIECVHYRDVYVIVIGNTVTSLIRAPNGQYHVCAMQRYLRCRDRKYSQFFNMDSKRTVSSVRIIEMSMLEIQFAL